MGARITSGMAARRTMGTFIALPPMTDTSFSFRRYPIMSLAAAEESKHWLIGFVTSFRPGIWRSRMGLNERRKIKELQEVTFPSRVKEIEEICGAPIPYEVDWESLADDPAGLNYIDNIA